MIEKYFFGFEEEKKNTENEMKIREKLSTHAFVLNDDGNGCCCVQLFNIPEFTCYRID